MTRDYVAQAKCSAEEKGALLTLARQERVSPSELIRYLIREEARRRRLWPPPVRQSQGDGQVSSAGTGN